MSSVHRDVQLVDLNGNPISADDQDDAATWPASNLVDGWHREPGSALDDEPPAAERADFEASPAVGKSADAPVIAYTPRWRVAGGASPFPYQPLRNAPGRQEPPR